MGARDPSAPWFRHLCQTQPYFAGNSWGKGATEFPSRGRPVVALIKIERQNFLGKIVTATGFPADRISCDNGIITQQKLIVMWHGERQDTKDPSWKRTAVRVYDTPITKHGMMEANGIARRRFIEKYANT